MITIGEKTTKLEAFFGVEKPDDVGRAEWIDTLENMEAGFKKKISKSRGAIRKIPEVVEDIKNILNDTERTQDGELLVDIDELVNEILVINSNNISIETYKQVAHERDIAIEQLHELGYEFGEKIDLPQHPVIKKVSSEELKSFSQTDGSYSIHPNPSLEIPKRMLDIMKEDN